MRLSRLALLMGVAALPCAAIAAPAKPKPAPRAPAAAAVKPIAFTQRTLANGLRVYAIRDTGTTNVAVQVWYDVGSKNDPKGRSGFAHMFEHLMFKATRNLVPEQMDRLTEDVGGYNNASTNDDFTNYYEVVPANHLQRLLFAEADRMASLVVEPVSFASERDVVKEELRQRVLAQPYGKLFSIYFPEVSYAVHPYARPGIGSLDDLQAASIEDVRAFHAAYYRPDNAILVVAGNFDPADLDRWVDQYFAPIKRPDRPIPRVTVTEPPRTAPVSRTVHEPNTPLPAVLMSFQVPPDRDADNAALAVLNTILSGGESSRLYHALVYRDQIAQSADSFLDSKQDTGALAVFAIMAGGKTADQGEAALRRELDRLRQTPVTAAELTEAKNQIVTQTLRSRETADGKASAIANAVIIDGDPAAADKQLAAIAKVTAADVLRVAKKYLDPRGAATIRYLPAAEGAKPDANPIALAPTVQVAPLAMSPSDIPVITPAPEGERLQPPAPGAPVKAILPVPVQRKLANGLTLVVVEKHDLPLVTASLIVRAGSARDPENRAGLANLSATLMTKGTTTRTATAIAEQIESLGGSISSDAGWDSSSVDIGVKSDQVDKALTILADVARNPVFAADELERARTQAVDSIDVALKNPATVAGLTAQRAVFGASAYGHIADGTPASLKAITRDDVVSAYRAAWRPDTATLVLVGDISVAKAEQLANATLGNWKAAAANAPSVNDADAGPIPAPRHIVVDFPGAGQAGVVIARRGIKRQDDGYYAAAVANATLGVGFSSRLNQEIRIKRGLAYGAGSQLAARRDVGPFAASTQTKNESAAEVVSLMVDELNRLGTTPAAPAELDTRKAVLIGGFGRGAETTGGLAGIIGTYVTNGVPLSELGSYAAKLQAVTPAEVQAAAKRIMDPSAASIVVVGESAKFLDAFRKLYPDAEVIPASALNLDSPTLR